LTASEVLIRDFQHDDAERVSALFVAVYQQRYVYPEVYLPSLIRAAVEQRRWFCAVALAGERLVGHAALLLHYAQQGEAELAMNVVHPDWRGRGLSSALGRHLCAWARARGQLELLTIKQVCSHEQSQWLAQRLGFQTTGLLLDYVASPFAATGRESIVLGCLPLDGDLPPARRALELNAWFDVETTPPRAQGQARFRLHDGRLDIALASLDAQTLAEITALPRSRLIHLSLPLDRRTQTAVGILQQAGFASAGAMPDGQGRWRWMLQRGFRADALSLCCPRAQLLYRQMCAHGRN
jgi:GNAT superfamily N-acetyltransferase